MTDIKELAHEEALDKLAHEVDEHFGTEVVTRYSRIWLLEFADRLAARVPDGCVVVPKDLIDAAKNLLAVKGRHHTELAYKQLCQALIAAGGVK